MFLIFPRDIHALRVGLG